jgi:hypothetical protein
MKSETVNAYSKADAKYLTLIDHDLRQIKHVRAKMKRSKAEIDRLAASSRRKLAEIDAILALC